MNNKKLYIGYSHFNGQQCVTKSLFYETYNCPNILLYFSTYTFK